MSLIFMCRITRLATFPDYLLIQLKKFTIKEDWTPAKLDVAVEMPWEVSHSCSLLLFCSCWKIKNLRNIILSLGEIS